MSLASVASLALLAAAALGACGGADEELSHEAGNAVIARDQEPMTSARLDAILAARGVRTLDGVPAVLPKDFVVNFTLKHGKLREGERGHLVERDVSQSSDPLAPRVIAWDERSGFMISYNGGTPGQTEGQRLDVLELDEPTKTFRLSGLVFDGAGAPRRETDANIADPSRKCARCHGPQMRPIFSMYPDWPSFYGSDNDELTDATKEVQALEARDYADFRALVTRERPPRYAPLYDAANVKAQFRGTELWASFPYRPDTDTTIRAVSRAFAFRPSLRLGILANRLVAQHVAQRIGSHASFASLGPLFLHGVLQCKWSSPSALAQSGRLADVERVIGRAPRTVAGGRALHYRDLLAIFGLEVRDVDIRYAYGHAGYANDDASDKPMEVGYVDGSYWNGYFDGSATLDELLAMQLVTRLSSGALPSLEGFVTSPDGLVVKYARLSERFAFDKDFFEEMDERSRWIPIPYPTKLQDLHHRERFTERFASQHTALCEALEAHVGHGAGAAGAVATTCPASCVASTYCKDHANASQAVKVNGLPCVVSGAGGCQPCR